MTRSSARSVPYDLRPSKQIERRLIIEYLEKLKECGFSVSSYRYVGFGGFKYYDFIMVFRYVGIRRMISLERDERLYPRCEFNKPYDFIESRNETALDYFKGVEQQPETIYWLDYDFHLDDSVMEEIHVLADRIKSPSVVFVTINVKRPGDYPGSDDQRLKRFKEEYGDLSGDVELVDVEDASFHQSYLKTLQAALKQAFASSDGGVFESNFGVVYRDGTRMLTLGGLFASQEDVDRFRSRLTEALEFVVPSEDSVFEITNHNLSERERSLVDYAASTEEETAARKKLVEIGVGEEVIEDYARLLRHLPRYFESVI